MGNNQPTEIGEPLRLGIIGAGEITRLLLPMMQRHGIEPVAITDLNKEAAQALATAQAGLRVVADTAALLALPEVEAVYVATPPSTHSALFEQVLRAGKHLIGEKPWVFNAAEAERVSSLASIYPNLVVASCATRCRFSPAVDAAERLLAQRALGRLRFVRMIAQIGPPKPQDQLPRWKLTPGATPGGVSADWSVYELEWLRGVLKEDFDPVAVHAVFDHWNREGTPFESSYQFTLTCRNGIKILITRTAQVGPSESLVQIRGEAGGIDLPFTPGASIPCLQHYFLNADKQLQTQVMEGTEGNWEDHLMGPFDDARRAIREGRTPMADAASQVLIHQILDAVYASARQQQVVEIAAHVEPVRI